MKILKITEIKFETERIIGRIWHPKKEDCLDATSSALLKALIKHLEKKLKELK